MLNKINFKYLVGAIGALSFGLLTMVGVIQNHIHFAGVEDEAGFTFIAMFIGVMCLFGIKK
jgi:hypothetical protein|tara:strand:- start:70 stop:252 length:183 start_codon:yes stop_codon:yes gene_type:complete